MRINGKVITGVNIETLYIPRGEDVIVFKIKAILDMDEFNKLCPRPEPPKKLMAGGQIVADFNYPGFQAELSSYAEKRLAWTVIKGLQATDMEWDTVDINNPGTWLGWRTDLKNAGFNHVEISRIENATMAANCLNDAKLDEARKRFLAGELGQPAESLSQTAELKSTQSGEPANESESDLQE